MPIHVAPLSRRDFLTRTAAAAAGLSLVRISPAAPSRDDWSIAFLSDTHIAANPAALGRGINMADHLRQVVREVQALPERPQAVIVNGDCALQKGTREDYVTFGNCIQPLVDAGYSLHMTMGNHDERGAFYDVFSSQRPDHVAVDSKHVSIIETPHANLFLLDSMKQVAVVTGELGEAQRAWLEKVLDSHAEKPAVLIAHHTLQKVAPPEGKPWGGLADTAAFLDLIRSRKHVRAYVFGHSHRWSHEQDGPLHLVNLPAVGYVFDPAQTSAWVHARITSQGMEFQFRSLDPAHPFHQQIARVDWSA